MSAFHPLETLAPPAAPVTSTAITVGADRTGGGMPEGEHKRERCARVNLSAVAGLDLGHCILAG
jgi:hypothetical protein